MATNDDFVREMRRMADFFEANPELPKPYYSANVMWGSNTTKAELAEIARAAARFGLPVTKEFTGNTFTLGIGSYPFQFEAYSTRDKICRAVVTGTETKMVPDYDNVPKVEKEVDIIEWHCDEPLLASSKEENG